MAAHLLCYGSPFRTKVVRNDDSGHPKMGSAVTTRGARQCSNSFFLSTLSAHVDLDYTHDAQRPVSTRLTVYVSLSTPNAQGPATNFLHERAQRLAALQFTSLFAAVAQYSEFRATPGNHKSIRHLIVHFDAHSHLISSRLVLNLVAQAASGLRPRVR